MTVHTHDSIAPPFLACATPYLLGHQLTNAFVAVFFDDTGTICVTARVDPPAQLTAEEWREHVEGALGHIPAAGPTFVCLLAFSQSEDFWDYELYARVAQEALDDLGLPTLYALAVLPKRWARIALPATADIPESGDIDDDLVAEVAHQFGNPALATREHLLARLEHDSQAEALLMAASPAHGPLKAPDPDAVDSRVVHFASALLADEPLDLAVAAGLLSDLEIIRLRDTLLFDLVQADESARHRALDKLIDVARAAPAGSKAPVATLAACVAYTTGGGPVLRGLAELALAENPQYTLAGLILTCYASGLPPQKWAQGLIDMGRDACLRPPGLQEYGLSG